MNVHFFLTIIIIVLIEIMRCSYVITHIKLLKINTSRKSLFKMFLVH